MTLGEARKILKTYQVGYPSPQVWDEARAKVDRAPIYVNCSPWGCFGSYQPKACGKRLNIKKLVYIQTMWYVPPSGCTSGGYWADGEGQFKCPHCGELNRLCERPDVVALKHKFKTVTIKYD